MQHRSVLLLVERKCGTEFEWSRSIRGLSFDLTSFYFNRGISKMSISQQAANRTLIASICDEVRALKGCKAVLRGAYMLI